MEWSKKYFIKKLIKCIIWFDIASEEIELFANPFNPFFMSDLLLIFSNLFMLLAIYASIKEQYFIEGWVLFQSMVVSMTYHALSSYKDSQPKLYSTFQFIDFYCAILVMITLSIFTVKVPEKYKGIPLNILGTFSLFMIFYDDFGIRVELIIAGICFFMVFGIFIFRKKCPEFKKHNLIKGLVNS